MNTIVVGIDGSACAHAAATWALDEAKRTGREVTFVHAWTFPPPADVYAMPTAAELETDARHVLEKAIAELDIHGVDTTSVIAQGPASVVLHDRAKDADLLVVGSEGHGAFVSMLIGSVALRVITRPPCPVVIVPPPE